MHPFVASNFYREKKKKGVSYIVCMHALFSGHLSGLAVYLKYLLLEFSIYIL